MEAELRNDTPCSSVAVDSILRIGGAGVLWGLSNGPNDAKKLGLKGLGQASFVAKSMGQAGAYCGIFAGVFSLTRCGIQNFRGQTDLINSAAAGAIAGVVVAAGTRSRKQVAGMAALLSIVCAAADYRTSY